MSVRSLTYQQSVFKRCHSDKHFQCLTHKMAAKINWHRPRCGTENYATVTRSHIGATVGATGRANIALTVASCKHAMSNDIPPVSVDCIRTLRANATSAAAAAAAVFYCGAERCDTDMTNASKKNLECKLYISVFSTPNSRLPISAFVICHGVDKRRPADANMK